MRALKAIAVIMLIGVVLQSCQKDEKERFKVFEAEQSNLKTGAVNFDCETDCIDPEDPSYYEKTEQLVVSWGGPNGNLFTKTVDIVYYNTLETFVLMVMSTEAIANLLVDGNSVKDFSNPIPAGTWYELTFPLPEGWEVCDVYGFELSVIGNGPPAVFDVEYHLIGECVYHTLSLAVNPEGAGIVTGAGEYVEGEYVELTATANEGYVFVNWTDEGGNIISDVADFTYDMQAEDHILTANFEARDTFECGSIIFDGSGFGYETVLIGEQCWMNRNLETYNYHNGIPIVHTGSDNNAWENNTSGAVIEPYFGDYYGYGLLYNWYAVNNENGLCPAGWHVPTDDDWTQLIDYVISQGFPNSANYANGAGFALKSCRQYSVYIVDDCYTMEHPFWGGAWIGDGFDEFGFSALPGGFRNTQGEFFALTYSGYWWSSTELSLTNARAITITDWEGGIKRVSSGKSYGYSVRCIRD